MESKIKDFMTKTTMKLAQKYQENNFKEFIKEQYVFKQNIKK